MGRLFGNMDMWADGFNMRLQNWKSNHFNIVNILLIALAEIWTTIQVHMFWSMPAATGTS